MMPCKHCKIMLNLGFPGALFTVSMSHGEGAGEGGGDGVVRGLGSLPAGSWGTTLQVRGIPQLPRLTCMRSFTMSLVVSSCASAWIPVTHPVFL